MIVKNEAKVIRRCLDSVLSLVGFVVIEETWQNFAYNRSHALAQLRGYSQIDYALIIDADEVLVFEPGFDAQALKWV